MTISINQKGFPGFAEPQLEGLELILNDLKDSGDLGGGAGTAADLADLLEDAATTDPAALARIKYSVSGATAAGSADEVGRLNPERYKRWRKALANARSGIASANLLVIGDSTSRGLYAASTNAQASSWPALMVGEASLYGVPAKFESIIGFGSWAGGLSTLLPQEARLTHSGMTIDSANAARISLGGLSFQLAAAGWMQWSPVTAVTQFEVYYRQSTTHNAGGTFAYSVDGGAATNLATTGANAFGSVIVNAGAAGAHTLKLDWVSGAIAIVAIVARNTPTHGINLLNASEIGVASGGVSVSTNPWSPTKAIAKYAPALTIIDIGINDELQSVAVATFKANMQLVITAALAVGDVVIKTHTPCSVAAATQQAYVDALYDLAGANSLDIVDVFARWGGGSDYASLSTLGYYTDSNHPTPMGYRDEASLMSRLIWTA